MCINPALPLNREEGQNREGERREGGQYKHNLGIIIIYNLRVWVRVLLRSCIFMMCVHGDGDLGEYPGAH